MIQEILFQLKNFEQSENIFGEDFIDAISYGESLDAYVIRVYEYPAIALMKENSFEENYFALIRYLTDMKNQYMNNSESHDETRYYCDWLRFRRSYNIRKAWFYLNVHDTEDAEEVQDLFVSILGKLNYHTLTVCLHTSQGDYRSHADIVMEYVGNTRAIRDLCMKFLDPKYGTQWQFHLWHLTPCTIIENYGYIFYLGNEMSSLAFCPYQYQAKEYYYESLYHQLYRNVEIDTRITKEQKDKIWEEINREVTHLSSEPDEIDNLDDMDFGFDEEFEDMEDHDEADS